MALNTSTWGNITKKKELQPSYLKPVQSKQPSVDVSTWGNITNKKELQPTYLGGKAESKSSSGSSSKSESSSKSRSSKVDASQRSTAQDLFNSLLNIPTANAATTAPNKKTPTAIGRGMQMLTDPFALAKGGRSLLDTLADIIPGASNYLFKDQEQEFRVGDNLSRQETERAYTTIRGENPNEGQVLRASTDQPYQTTRTSGGDAFANAWAQATSNNRGTSSRVTQPSITSLPRAINQPITPDISSAYTPDLTPVQNTPGTVRQFLGNGYLSNGSYSNGEGDYGIEGSLTGTELNQTWDDFIAASEDFYKEIDPQLYRSNPEYKAVADQLMAHFGEEEQDIGQGIKNNLIALGEKPNDQQLAMAQQAGLGRGASQGENYSMKTYNQGSSKKSSSSLMEKFYKQQEKAVNKAWKEQQKSIESQYNTDVSTGTSELEKAKQEDLLKLGGMFNFANQDPNSEQRVQYMQRTQGDYASKLNELIAKLSQAKNQAVSSGKQGYQSQVGSIAQARAQAQQQVQQLQQQQQQQQFENAMKLGSYRNSMTNSRNNNLQDLLSRAANMPSGGREYAQGQANNMGLGNIGGYTPDNWESVYRKPTTSNSFQGGATSVDSDGNPIVFNPQTGQWEYK